MFFFYELFYRRPFHALERTQLVKITIREFLDDITEYKLNA